MLITSGVKALIHVGCRSRQSNSHCDALLGKTPVLSPGTGRFYCDMYTKYQLSFLV